MAHYVEAAKVLEDVIAKKASLKTLVFSSNSKNKKQLYALVVESLRYRDVLEQVLDHCGLVRHVKALRGDRWLALVLLYEHLLGKRLSGRFKDVFIKQKSSIHAQCEMMKVRAGVTHLKHLVSKTDVQLPKYVRVNAICARLDQVIQVFVQTGYTLVPCDTVNFFEVMSKLSGKTFTKDPHIPNLLVFPPSTDFHSNNLYKKGHIIIQDKASCMPAYILSPPGGATVIDSCAAPGNKTSHLAAIMNNKGMVYAFDKDRKRLETLQMLMNKCQASCVQAKCADFLTVDPRDPKYKDVEYILVDPSCSGSGMINRVSQHTDETDSMSTERLEQLAQFQVSLVCHALSFPRIRRVTYSTCSIHEQENEQVVETVLQKCGDKFTCANIMPEWPIRGVKGYRHAQFCLRMSHDQALTNGFFVACFERLNCDQINGCNGSEKAEGQQKIESSDKDSEIISGVKSSDLNYVMINSVKRKGGVVDVENKKKKKKQRKRKNKQIPLG